MSTGLGLEHEAALPSESGSPTPRRAPLPSRLASSRRAALSDGPECPLPAALPGHGGCALGRWGLLRMHLRGWRACARRGPGSELPGHGPAQYLVGLCVSHAGVIEVCVGAVGQYKLQACRAQPAWRSLKVAALRLPPAEPARCTPSVRSAPGHACFYAHCAVVTGPAGEASRCPVAGEVVGPGGAGKCGDNAQPSRHHLRQLCSVLMVAWLEDQTHIPWALAPALLNHATKKPIL